jgi:hypothetical protein
VGPAWTVRLRVLFFLITPFKNQSSSWDRACSWVRASSFPLKVYSFGPRKGLIQAKEEEEETSDFLEPPPCPCFFRLMPTSTWALTVGSWVQVASWEGRENPVVSPGPVFTSCPFYPRVVRTAGLRARNP